MYEQHLISMELPPLPYYITIGMSTYSPGEQHPSRLNLGIFDQLWVVKGTLFIGENDRQWEVTEGQALLLLPNRYHYPVKACETETVFYWIHFDFQGSWHQTSDRDASPASQVRQTWDNPYTLQVPQYASLPDFDLAKRLLGKLMACSNQHRSFAFWNEQQLFMELLHLLEEKHTGDDASPASKLADKTEAYLRQHYQQDVSNETIAEALHFHPNYIVRCMKEVYQCTPMEFLHEYRMEQAKLLLVKTEWSIAQIAEHVGFQYAPYFSSCFKQYAGISPLRFRKQFSP